MRVCVLIVSCDREPLIQPQKQTTVESPRVQRPTNPQFPVGRIISSDQVPHVIQKLNPYLKKYREVRSEALLNIDSVHTDYMVLVSIPDSISYPDSSIQTPVHVYSLYVGTDIPNTLFNIYIEELEDGTLTDPYVLMCRMDSTFAESYYSNNAGFDEFVGAAAKVEMEVLFGNIFRGGDLASLQKCWELVFGEPLDIVIPGYINPPSPGSPGGGPGSPSNRPPGVGTYPDGSSGIPGSGNTGSGNTGSGGTEPSGCWWFIQILYAGGSITTFIWDEGCDNRPVPITLWGGSNDSSIGRDPFYLDCIRMLIMAGLIERPIAPDPTQLNAVEKLALDLNFEYATTEYYDIIDCLNNNKLLFFTVQDLLNDLSDPCNPSVTPEEMLHNSLETACSGQGDDLAELYDGLAAMSKYFTFLIEYGFDLDELNDSNIDFSSCCAENDFNLCAELTYNANVQPNSDGITDILDFANEEYTGEKANIPDCIQINDSTEIEVEFGITASDSLSADQEVAICLIDALISALTCTIDSFEITKIYISATTNGKHSATSNHSRALAIDLSRINDVKMSLMTEEELKSVKKLQECLEDYTEIRENFGPSLKKKLGQDYDVSGHSDHMHFSVNSDASCDDFEVEDYNCD